MQFNLYLVTNILDGTRYVGKTVQTLERRWGRHQSEARYGITKSHLHRAIREYGVENFIVEPCILLDDDLADEVSLNDAERLMIRLLRINGRLYNITDGGGGVSGWKHSADAKRKISESNRGQTRTEESRHRMSEANRGRIVSEETRRKISEAHRGRKPSEEARRKMSEAQKGKIISADCRRKISEAKRGKGQPWSEARRTAAKNRQLKTHCLRGHELTPDNRCVHGQCRICQREAQRAAYHRRKQNVSNTLPLE